MSSVYGLCTGDNNTILLEVSPALLARNEHDFIAAGYTYYTGDTILIFLFSPLKDAKACFDIILILNRLT
ncbi:MAG TPA: hypothetical protein VKA95_09160 [Nitrososphaeraceae archaeon]|nr:hypothetical protein [Nitrososphaeraceae archaeon]